MNNNYVILIVIFILVCLFLIYYYNNYTYNRIYKLNSIYPPTIKSDETFFFVRTKYRNISFDQCIRSNDYISNYIKESGKWDECQEIFDIWNSSRKDGIFIDIGGNIGSCSFIFAQVGVKVYAFEPLANNLFLFSLTTFSNVNFRKYITIYPYALGKKEKIQLIHVQKGNWGGSSIYYNNTGYVQSVHVKKIDEFNDLIPIKTSMIKIDVEGGEYDIFEGGKDFFKNHKSEYMYIEAECGNNIKKIYDIEKLYLKLNDIGYDIIRKIDCNKIIKGNIIAKIKNV